MFGKGDFKKLTDAELKESLSGKNVLIVGGTAGIGKALALSLLERGSKVWIVGRRKPDESLSKAQFIQKDLTLLRTAESLVADVDVKALDIVVFTNGILANKVREVTPEGIEKDLAVSYLSRYAFVKKLLKSGFGSDRSDKSRKPRIFVMGYPGKEIKATLDDFNSEQKYGAWSAHMNTVVGNEALVTYIADADSSVNCYGLNPGVIRTEIRENFLGKDSWASFFLEGIVKATCQSAETYAERVLVHLLASSNLETRTKGENTKKVMEESEKLLQKALSVQV